ncbi:MAG TPA: ankyrin repeat domain-containing protein [Pseudonocardiaceae bacterium]|jgi:ankyrin repeat protein|nr:ankyrin repeat domain-containing protein [Pseudonocardiaceae bacterium]
MAATTALPTGANLDQLRKRAKDLHRAVLAGDPDALARIGDRPPAAFRLACAQLVIAREYGFASWARLKRHVSVLTEFTRTIIGPPAPETAPLDALLQLGCLLYAADDGPEQWARARELLAAHPDLRGAGIHVAAMLADVEQVRRLLAGDRRLADRQGGPHRWEPLLYLAYSRIDPTVSAAAVRETARLLLDAGADANAGFFHNGLPSPFTVLTGAFGEGERGPLRQPRHPHSLELARILLAAGADPNDSQTLYNRMFEPGNDHLELLFSSGLGGGPGGPWRTRLVNATHPPADAIPSPARLLRDQLRWAVNHGFVERVRLLLAHGVDPGPIEGERRSPADQAARAGYPEVVSVLVEAGGPAPTLRGPAALVAAVLAGADDSALVGSPALAKERIPMAILDAVSAGRPAAVRRFAELGFDVNARGRHTALHEAAANNDVAMIELLLSLGADPEILDTSFNATPLGWAEYNYATEATARLSTLD